MSDKFNRILPHTLKVEGGYTVDHAGPTNYGVTQSAYDSYNKSKKLPLKDVKDITYGEVSDLYERDFYKGPRINQLPEKLGGVVFDYAVNSGPKRAVRALQETIGAEADGIIGPKTLAAVNEYIAENGEGNLVNNILMRRSEFLTNLIESNPEKYGRFSDGWANRIRELQSIYGETPSN